MKLLITTLLLFGTFVTQAQKAEDYVNYIKSSVAIDIKKVVYENLDLSNDQLNDFDPVFDKYLEKEAELAMEKLLMFQSYAKQLNTLSADQLDEMNEDLFDNEVDQAQLERKYYKRFTKVIGVNVNKATKFFFVKKNIDSKMEVNKLEFLRQ